ncbi:MAG: hypothetical protein RQ855_04620 [Desulfurococcales archaeon]|nr:hypothetical protein [Desulfurococcales archaeon]
MIEPIDGRSLRKVFRGNTPLQDIQLGGGKLYIIGLDPFIGRLGISLRAGWKGIS